MKKLGAVLIAVLLLVGVGFGIKVLYFSDSEPETKISEESVQEDKDKDLSTELDKATITLFSTDGGTKWELEADTIQQFQKKPQVSLAKVTARVYKQGRKVIDLTAESGTVDTKTSFLSLQGPIRIEGGGRVLKADKLNWNQAKDQLIGTGNVMLKKPGATITGDSFIARIDLEKVRIKGQVKAIYSKAGDQNE